MAMCVISRINHTRSSYIAWASVVGVITRSQASVSENGYRIFQR